MAQDSETSGTEELSLNFGFFSEHISISQNDVKNWARDGGEALASALVDGALTTQVQQGLMIQYGLTQGQLDNFITQFESALSQSLGNLSEEAVDNLFNASHPTNIVRMGSGNPFRTQIEGALAAVPAGMTAGSDGLGVGDLFDIQFNTDGAANILLAGFGSLLETQQSPDFRSLLDDFVIIESLSYSIPINYDSISWSAEGVIAASLQGVSLSGPQGANISGAFSLHHWTSGSVHTWIGAGFSLPYDFIGELGSTGTSFRCRSYPIIHRLRFTSSRSAGKQARPKS